MQFPNSKIKIGKHIFKISLLKIPDMEHIEKKNIYGMEPNQRNTFVTTEFLYQICAID